MLKAIFIQKPISLLQDFPDKIKVHPIFKCLQTRAKDKLSVSNPGHTFILDKDIVLLYETSPTS